MALWEYGMPLGMNRNFVFSVLAASFCGLLFGYDIGAISTAAPELRVQFSLAASGLGLGMSSALFGTIAGSMSAGLLRNSLDRRQLLFISGLIYTVGVLGAAITSDFAEFVIGRFICGIAIGLISVVAPMYLAEISPSHMRGRVVGTFQVNVSIGVVVAFVLGYVFSRHIASGLAWRYSLAGGAVPALLGEMLLVKASPSPRWLVLRKRFAEARSALTALGFNNADADYEHLVDSFQNFRIAQRSTLFSRQYTKPLLLAVSIAVFNQLTGVNALLYYVLDVFRELGSGHLNGRRDAIVVATLSLFVTVTAMTIIDRVGRKPLLLIGAAGMGSCLVLLPVIRYTHWPLSTVVIVLICYNAFFGFSQGAVIWVYLSEIFPLPVRAQGQSLGSTVHWITNAFVVATFPEMAKLLGEKIFVLFAVLMAAQFLIVLLLYPETKHANLENLASEISR